MSFATDEHEQTGALMMEERQARQDAARRERAEARRLRLLDARQRTVGMDHAALLAQMREKEERREAERAEEREYMEEMERMGRAVEAYEAEARAAKAARAREFAAERQRLMEATRAAKALESDSGAVGMSEARRLGAGPASALVFDGEDPRAAERAALQRAQMQEWASEQEEARRRQKEEEEREARAHAQWLSEAASRADAYEAETLRARREAAAAVAEENRRLAMQAQRVREEESKREAEELAHSVLPSGLGEEHVEDGDASATLGPGRIRRDHFRGMTDAQRRQVLREQAQQAAYAEAMRRREAAEAAQEEERKREAARRVARYEAEAKASKAARQREHMAALQRQIQEDASRRTAEAAQEREPAIGDAFFAKFGQSDR